MCFLSIFKGNSHRVFALLFVSEIVIIIILRKNLPGTIVKLLKMGKIYHIPFGFILQSSFPLPRNVICWVILGSMGFMCVAGRSKSDLAL